MMMRALTANDTGSLLCRAVRRFAASRGDGSSGIAAIEFAIVAPTLVLLFICTADLSLGIYRKMQVQNAAQSGAAYAMLYGFAQNSISSAVTNATGFSAVAATPQPNEFCGCPSATSGVTGVSCSSTCPSGATPGTYVTVSAQATYQTILPYPLVPNSFTFNAQSTVRLQ
jgi:Flp pilus assembly protein TadG